MRINRDAAVTVTVVVEQDEKKNTSIDSLSF